MTRQTVLPTLTVALILLGAAACIDSTGVENSSTQHAPAFSRTSGPARTSGHAEVQGTPIQNIQSESYSFTAVATGPAPQARGQVQVHFVRFTGEEVKVHADVTCLAVVGDQAWIGSRVRRFIFDGEEVITQRGRPMIVRVRDLGQGEGTADLASLVFFPPIGSNGDLTHCVAHPAFPTLFVSTNGNIQVAGE